MSGVELRAVDADEGDVRLDRWFRRHFPDITHGRLQKLLRTGQIRVDGRRVGANARLNPGQQVRIPPIDAAPAVAAARPAPGKAPDPDDVARLRAAILHEDDALLVLNKPPGLAVQGGSKTERHVDGILTGLARPGERLRLVHRLDRDTGGLLVIARSAAVAARLGDAFRRHQVQKLYWALVAGRPALRDGVIDWALAKQMRAGREQMQADEDGRPARTIYRTVARTGKVGSWLALMPETGRTHQLRAHCAALETPILGDRKYGGPAARPAGAPPGLMLHARELRLPHPDGGSLALSAPLAPTIRQGFQWLGFEPDPSLPGARIVDFELP